MPSPFLKTVQSALNQENGPFQYSIYTINQAEEIYHLYKSYDGCLEFLYIPSLQEIKNNFSKTNTCYLGAQTPNGKIISVSKIEQLELPSPFFVPPTYEAGDKPFFGLSGMLVSKDFRQHGIAKTTISAALKALSKTNAAGIYADCDFRNVASFSTLSGLFNFVGYTDGRNGADGEKTIYTTFYKSFSNCPTQTVSNLMFNLSAQDDLNQIHCSLQNKMTELGSFSSYKIPYGSGYNQFYILNENIKTPNLQLITRKEKPILLKKQSRIFLSQNKQEKTYE